MNILAARRFFTLTAFDVTTEQGRSDERYRLAVLSMVANVISRGVAMVVMVLTVSLTIPYLGVERFGVWMTIASFAGLLSFLDLGVGNALANRVSQVAAYNDSSALRKAISGGLGYLFFIGCGIAALLFLISNLVPWQRLIKVNDVATSIEAKNAIIIFSLLFGLSIFTNGLQRVFAGLQQAFIPHLVSLIGSIFSLFGLILAVTSKANITYLLLATLGIQLGSNLLLLLILKIRNLITSLYLTANIKSESRNLFRAGGLFFILQIGTMVGWGADSLIIASTLGAGQVAIFNIVQRLFQFISQPLGMINSPFWSAYADAHARGDKLFIKKTLFKSIILTGIVSLSMGLVFLFAGIDIVRIWSSGSIIPPFGLILVFFVWTIIETLGNAFAMMLNGCGVVGMQVVAVLIFISLAIPLKFILVSYGLPWILLSTIAAYMIAVPLFYFALKKGEIKKLFNEN
jgi:O-antigen/teichoic acid export membrane protein